MATASPPVIAPLHQQLIPTRFSSRTHNARKLKPSISLNAHLHQPSTFPLVSLSATSKSTRSNYILSSVYRAYVTGPPIVTESDPRIDDSEPDSDKTEASNLISRKLLWSLFARHKFRLCLSVLALVGGTTCTLSMPIFSGRFFEVLIGTRSEPLWKLLSKVGLLYSLEPIFTVIFVAEFFDRYKVGELSGLLTSDLGSLKDVVSENISRDRGFRALSEASHYILK
ncbi:hypothetical protein F3Y22_tig00111843pilonHSYRG00085 [Hibiscus syriacus]|uniref:ABC transmembrane type-1 domain-containing protein n=1 Tax=Hibiscus syriacus TaxID=106335 RepID=A0A6A2XAQ6_HIBSY|nr:hypothetical protein F3Y22_tig00111843pilonHSYRG00085 [Hibiscus syriacus]